MDIEQTMSAIGFELKSLKEPKTPEELMDQIALLSKEIEKSEKMMQHLAFSMSGSNELDMYLSNYKQLVARKEELIRRQQAARFGLKSKAGANRTTGAWWKFWRR